MKGMRRRDIGSHGAEAVANGFHTVPIGQKFHYVCARRHHYNGYQRTRSFFDIRGVSNIIASDAIDVSTVGMDVCPILEIYIPISG